MTEKPWVIGSGYHIRDDFELWNKQMTEIRYTPFVSVESIQEGMIHMLQKFQPLVHKVMDVYKEAGKGQKSQLTRW